MSSTFKTQRNRAFQLKALTAALSATLVLTACGGGGNTVDSIAPAPDLGHVNPNSGTTNSNNNTGQTDSTESNSEQSENYKLHMSSNVSALMLNRGTNAKISVRALDGENHGVVAGKEVTFSITDPNLTGVINKNSSKIMTNDEGIATITLEIVNTLTQDQIKYLKENGITITAKLGKGESQINLKGTESQVTAQKNSFYDLYITTSKPQLNTGTDTMMVSVDVRNKNGGIESGVPVNFSIVNPAKYGIVLNGKSNQVTNDKGQVQIEVKQSSTTVLSRLNHETKLMVTVDDGKNAVESMSLPLQSVGTQIIGISSADVLADNEKTSVKGRLIDGDDKSISNLAVALMNEGRQVAKTTTDINGNFTFSNITSNQLSKNNGSYVFDIIANPEGESQTFNDVIKLAAISSTGISIPNKDIVVNEMGEIVVLVPNANNGDEVTLTTTKGLFDNNNSRQTANVLNGQAVFNIRSQVPGTFTVTALHNNNKQSRNLTFVSVSPVKVLLQAKNIQMSTNSSTEIKVRVLDANGSSVKNAIVNFSVIKDSSGGYLDQAIAKTDENGVAIVSYTSGSNPTANEGVEIQAKVRAVDLPNGQVKTVNLDAVKVKLTVQTTATSIAVGLANKISDDASKVYYFRNASAFVTNNSGQPARNQLVTVSLKPRNYSKGSFGVEIRINGDTVWDQRYVSCSNEDVNFNGILDEGEDANNNGQLDPGYQASLLSNSLVSTSGSGVYNLMTDDKGRVDFQLRYLKEYADWFTMTMTVATIVDGSESSQSRIVTFPIMIDDQDISNMVRPNLNSPFGTHQSCLTTY